MNSHRMPNLKPYLVAALINFVVTGLSIFTIMHGKELLIWLPSGCALATLLILGLRFWPCIAGGVLAASIALGLPIFSVLGMVLSITAVPLITAYLLLYFKFDPRLEHSWDLFLLLAATVLHAAIGSTIVLMGQSIAGLIPWAMFGKQWVVMWTGDITSLLVVVPAILVWRKPLNRNFQKRGWRIFEASLVVLALVGCILYFVDRNFREVDNFYVFFPFLIWAGLRFGRHGATGAIILLVSTITGIYSFRFPSHAYPINDLSSFESAISIVAVVILILAFIVSERHQVETKLKDLNENLEQRVLIRTEALTTEIRERLKFEAALQESEEKYRNIIENSVDGILLVDEEGTIQEWNHGLENIWGFTKDRVIGKKVWDIHLKVFSNRSQGKSFYELNQDRVHQLFSGEIPIPRKAIKFLIDRPDGTFRTIQFTLFFIHTQEKHLLSSIIRDVTDQELLTEQIHQGREELRQLAQRVVKAQEEERHRISRELHDQAGQDLTALKINLELITKELPADLSSLHKSLQDAVSLTSITMEQIRNIAMGLRPPALDTVGLNYTLEELCRDFAKRTDINVFYQGENVTTLTDAESICLYRVLQESFTNIYKHAQAHHVQVFFKQESQMVSLTISDDGLGFLYKPLEGSSPSSGIGLLGMKERLITLEGQLSIESKPGQGTKLVASIPVR